MLTIRVQVMGSSQQSLGYFTLLTVADRSSVQLTAFPTPRLADASGFTRSFAASTGKEASQDINMVRGTLFYHLSFTGPQGLISPAGSVGDCPVPEYRGRIAWVLPLGLYSFGPEDAPSGRSIFQLLDFCSAWKQNHRRLPWGIAEAIGAGTGRTVGIPVRRKVG